MCLNLKFHVRTIWLLSLFSAWTLIFFSLSSNQEYYTFPVWTPLFILIAAVVTAIEEKSNAGWSPEREGAAFNGVAHGRARVFAVIGVLAAAALAWGLWDSRNLPYVSDIGTLLAHRGVGDYTLSMSHFFDLTGASFAALRLPAALAAAALLIGPAAGWLLRLKKRHVAATVSVAITAAVFLVAAHIAFARFDPMLGSKQLRTHNGERHTGRYVHYLRRSVGCFVGSFFVYAQVLCGQAGFFCWCFPLRPARRGVSTLALGFLLPGCAGHLSERGSAFKDLGTGERKWLFAQDTNQAKVEQLLKRAALPGAKPGR